MNDIQFKTNIKCMGCINAVKPYLENVRGLESWEVDLGNPDRIMTAVVENPEFVDDIKDALHQAGYQANEL